MYHGILTLGSACPDFLVSLPHCPCTAALSTRTAYTQDLLGSEGGCQLSGLRPRRRAPMRINLNIDG